MASAEEGRFLRDTAKVDGLNAIIGNDDEVGAFAGSEVTDAVGYTQRFGGAEGGEIEGGGVRDVGRDGVLGHESESTSLPVARPPPCPDGSAPWRTPDRTRRGQGS